MLRQTLFYARENGFQIQLRGQTASALLDRDFIPFVPPTDLVLLKLIKRI
jgi:hypothetical protein